MYEIYRHVSGLRGVLVLTKTDNLRTAVFLCRHWSWGSTYDYHIYCATDTGFTNVLAVYRDGRRVRKAGV